MKATGWSCFGAVMVAALSFGGPASPQRESWIDRGAFHQGASGDRIVSEHIEMRRDLMRYIRETFPGLTLEAPLFYRWPVGLRFDLGGRAVEPEQIDDVLRRANALFEAVFNDVHDQCIVVAQDWPLSVGASPGFSHLASLFVFARNQSVGLGVPEGEVEIQNIEEPEIGPHLLTWLEQSARSFRSDLIFGGIANADHARPPAISSRVYFINPASNVILHMYDDRGLDLIAASADALYELYHRFNPWILNYDRPRIDQVFAQ